MRSALSLDQMLAAAAEEIELSAKPPSERAQISVETEEALAAYVLDRFDAIVPRKRICPDHAAPWDVFRAAYFATHPVIVIKGSRGLAGKTWLLGLLAITEATLLGADVTILAGSGGQSARVHKAMARFWAAPGAPRDLVLGEPGVMKTKFKRGNEVEALTASQRSARSPHPQRLRLDEVDELDLAIFDAAMGQTMAAHGVAAQTVIASTHQNADGTFTEVLKRAAEKGWMIASWCWRETLKPHGWLDPSEVERKRSEMTETMWNTEVELQEPSAEGRAIDQDAVERMFDRALGETDAVVGTEEVFEPPDPSGSYATGADWGKRRDYSAIATLRTDASPQRFVAFSRDRRKPYHLMVPRLNVRAATYAGSVCHDAHGVGVVIDEMLTCESEGFTAWQGQSRRALFTEYISAIERDAIRAPRAKAWHAAHKYVTNDDLYGSGHPPDEFIACALAYRASRSAPDAVETYPLTW